MNTLDRVRSVIAEALYLEMDEIQANANLVKDLGAESIDFLDILFRLEKEFDIKLPREDLEQRARGTLSDADYAIEGQLTEPALRNLKSFHPEVPEESILPGLLVREIPTLFTVTTLLRMVEDKLNKGSEGGLVADAGSKQSSLHP